MSAAFVRVTIAAVTTLFLSVTAFADPLPADDQTVAQKIPALLDGAPVIGNPHAPVAIIEFFDYACSYCKAAEPRLEALIKSDKSARLVLKEFPILTPASMVATKAALAAVKQNKYAQFHQALMTYEGPLDEGVIFDTAKSVGLNVARLRKDMAAPDIDETIIANFNQARALRLFQTPAFIVGNHILTGPSAEINFPKAVAMARGK